MPGGGGQRCTVKRDTLWGSKKKTNDDSNAEDIHPENQSITISPLDAFEGEGFGGRPETGKALRDPARDEQELELWGNVPHALLIVGKARGNPDMSPIDLEVMLSTRDIKTRTGGKFYYESEKNTTQKEEEI